MSTGDPDVSSQIWFRTCGDLCSVKVAGQLVELRRRKHGKRTLGSRLMRVFDFRGHYDCCFSDARWVLDFRRLDCIRVLRGDEVRRIDLGEEKLKVEGGGYVVREVPQGMFESTSNVIGELNGEVIFELSPFELRGLFKNRGRWRELLRAWEPFGQVTESFDLERDLPVLCYALFFMRPSGSSDFH